MEDLAQAELPAPKRWRGFTPAQKAGVMPSGRFGVNAAWFRINALTFNVLALTVGRVDNAYSDRNLICSFPPIEEYATVRCSDSNCRGWTRWCARSGPCGCLSSCIATKWALCWQECAAAST